eukprot:COSAG06_NODE_2086_length_7632_cov_22.212133_1_plen_23_part_10
MEIIGNVYQIKMAIKTKHQTVVK